MALDEAIMESVRNNKSNTTIRLYGWKREAVTIGQFQGILNEVNMDACKKQNIDIVRRRTGGGAVYHDPEGEITYSIIGKEENFPQDLAKSYEYVCQPIINALKKIGLNAQFKPINDILVDDKKISGNAQTRKKGIFLQHGTILYSVNIERMFSLLKAGQTPEIHKLVQSVKKVVTSIKHHKEISQEEILKTLEEEFAKQFFNNEYEVSNYTKEELEKAQELKQKIYQTKEWNHQR